jgi:sarcosine oxidase/L-pipecolate oxidase
MADEASTPRILIVGAGIFGTSTAYHLSLSHAAPGKITVLDRAAYPAHHGASADINKIVRADYSSRFYMDLGFEALEAWKSWPVIQKCFHRSGWIALQSGRSDVMQRIRENFRARGSDGTSDVPVDDELRAKWKGLLGDTDFEDVASGYWNPDAGWADAADAVKSMLDDAVGRGVKYEEGDVEELLLGSSGIRGVKTKDGKVYEAEKILLASGAWTSQLLSPVEDQLGIEENDRVEKQVTAAGVSVVHYRLDDDEYERLRDMPIVVYREKGEIIPPPAQTRLLKFTNPLSVVNTITTPSGHRISVPPDRAQAIVSEKYKQMALESSVKIMMPAYVKRPADYWRMCWDTISPSQDQLLTQHPHAQLSNLYLAVGGSFHSWKFLPTIGKYIINVLNGESNGIEKDEHWKWKTEAPQGRGAHESVVPRLELRDLEG